MIFNSLPEVRGSMNNAMYIQSNSKSSDGDASDTWKKVFGDEARKVNPLFDIHIKRNDLIQNSIKTNDWSKYNEFQSKQHPAWYEAVDGKQVPNKVYYGNLIESKIKAMKEAKASGDQENAVKWEANLKEAITDFNNAPGIVPYIVGLNHNQRTAAEFGVEEPGDEFFDSKYNSHLVTSKGKFEANMWYDNAIFKEDASLKAQVEGLVAGTFPTSTSKPAENIAAEIITEVKDQIIPVEPELEVAKEVSETASFDLQEAYFQRLKNLQLSIKPSLNEALNKYQSA